MYILLLEVEEFSCEIGLPNIRLLNDAVFIIWEWNVSSLTRTVDDHESHNGSKSSNQCQLEEDKNDSETECHEEEETSQLIPYVTHTVVFKCIGSVRDAD